MKNDDKRNPGRPAYRLTFEDAVMIWKLKWQGWLQSRIAAHFDTNAGRVSEVLTGKRFPGSEQAAHASF